MRSGASFITLAGILGFAVLANAGAPPPKKESTMSTEVRTAIDTAVGHSKPKDERKKAIAQLAQLGDPAAVIPLASLLDGTETSQVLVPEVRKALAKLGAVSVLVKKLGSTDVEDKKLALELLGNLGDAGALEPVKAELGGAVREEAAVTLGRLGDRKAVPPLVELLADPSADVRMAAAYALGALGGPEAKSALEAAKKSESDGFVKIALEKSAAQAR